MRHARCEFNMRHASKVANSASFLRNAPRPSHRADHAHKHMSHLSFSSVLIHIRSHCSQLVCELLIAWQGPTNSDKPRSQRMPVTMSCRRTCHQAVGRASLTRVTTATSFQWTCDHSDNGAPLRCVAATVSLRWTCRRADIQDPLRRVRTTTSIRWTDRRADNQALLIGPRMGPRQRAPLRSIRATTRLRRTRRAQLRRAPARGIFRWTCHGAGSGADKGAPFRRTLDWFCASLRCILIEPLVHD